MLVAAGASACGGDSATSGSSTGALAAVSISGKPGEAPEVAYKKQMDATTIATKTLVTGDGAELKNGDQVLTHIYIGDGYTKKKSFSTYDQGKPEKVTVDKNLGPVFADAMEGARIGSRVAVTAPADKAFGPGGNPQLQIGNKDSVLVIVDPIKIFTPPKPVDVPASKLPGVVSEKGEPVALDFKGLPKPQADGDLLRSVVKEGTGATVTPSMSVTANYLGQVYGAKKPFDESYSKQPVPFSLSGVIPGWTYGLSGMKVGSRVLLQIPPELGYGAQAQPNIPANSTLYFVVDIVSAK